MTVLHNGFQKERTIMSQPENDSCPNCGLDNGSGLACSPCPQKCDDHDQFYDENDGCQSCSIDLFIDNLTGDQKEYLSEQIKIRWDNV